MFKMGPKVLVLPPDSTPSQAPTPTCTLKGSKKVFACPTSKKPKGFVVGHTQTGTYSHMYAKKVCQRQASMKPKGFVVGHIQSLFKGLSRHFSAMISLLFIWFPVFSVEGPERLMRNFACLVMRHARILSSKAS